MNRIHRNLISQTPIMRSQIIVTLKKFGNFYRNTHAIYVRYSTKSCIFSGIYSRGDYSLCSCKHLHEIVHSKFTYNSPPCNYLSYLSIGKLLNKLECSYMGCYSEIKRNLNDSTESHSDWKEANPKGYILHDSIYITFLND